MTQMDRSTFTPQQLSVEKLIKEQNFTWKARHRWLCGGVLVGRDMDMDMDMVVCRADRTQLDS